jgi:hypothetical protein
MTRRERMWYFKKVTMYFLEFLRPLVWEEHWDLRSWHRVLLDPTKFWGE